MFKQKTIVALVSLALSPALFAAQTTVQAEEVVVTATRTATPVSKVLSDVTVITREEIEETGATQLTELLARQPGVEVSSTGGPGSTASVYIRGANANHTLILVDGMRIVSGTLGTTALQHIPLELIERVEILRGPASSVYGADGIGGVIQVFTRRGDGTPKFHASLGFGEYGTVQAGAGINGKVGDTAFGLNLSQQSTNGFSSKSENDKSANPDRDAYREAGYNAYLSHTLAQGQVLTARAFQSFTNTEYDEFSNNGKQNELHHRLTGQSLESRNQLMAGWNSTLRYARTQDKSENFTDGNMDKRSSLFQTTQDEWFWLNDISTKFGRVSLGASHTQQEIDTTTAFVENEKTVKSAFAGYQGEFGANLFQANLRHDDDSMFGNKTTGSLGYGFRPAAGWLMRTSYGTAFKAPTFNDLYYPEDGGMVGNPDLQPETSHNLEAALEWKSGVNAASLTWFRNKVANLIEWGPDGKIVNGPWGPYDHWSVFNIGKARLAGYTLEGSTQFAGFDLSGSATWLDARNSETGQRLDRRAQRFANLNVSRGFDDWTLGGSLKASGERLDKKGAQVLPGYATVALYADVKIDREWTATARIENVTDRDYENAYGYNTGGRTWFVGVRYQPK